VFFPTMPLLLGLVANDGDSGEVIIHLVEEKLHDPLV